MKACVGPPVCFNAAMAEESSGLSATSQQGLAPPQPADPTPPQSGVDQPGVDMSTSRGWDTQGQTDMDTYSGLGLAANQPTSSCSHAGRTPLASDITDQQGQQSLQTNEDTNLEARQSEHELSDPNPERSSVEKTAQPVAEENSSSSSAPTKPSETISSTSKQELGTLDYEENQEDTDVDEDLLFPGFSPIVFYRLSQYCPIRYWCLRMITWPYPL